MHTAKGPREAEMSKYEKRSRWVAEQEDGDDVVVGEGKRCDGHLPNEGSPKSAGSPSRQRRTTASHLRSPDTTCHGELCSPAGPQPAQDGRRGCRGLAFRTQRCKEKTN